VHDCLIALCPYGSVSLWRLGGVWVCLHGRVSERKRYPSDLSDERWALIEPVITAWKSVHRSVSGHQGGYEMREIVNAILYQSRTGCQWEYLPHDLPPRSATYYYFAKWRDDGTDQAIHDLLCWHAREARGRRADPSLVVLDTQSVHAAASVPADTTGKDAAVSGIAVEPSTSARGCAIRRRARSQPEDAILSLMSLVDNSRADHGITGGCSCVYHQMHIP
jgi:transposase